VEDRIGPLKQAVRRWSVGCDGKSSIPSTAKGESWKNWDLREGRTARRRPLAKKLVVSGADTRAKRKPNWKVEEGETRSSITL